MLVTPLNRLSSLVRMRLGSLEVAVGPAAYLVVCPCIGGVPLFAWHLTRQL